jgi:hypothetical protein
MCCICQSPIEKERLDRDSLVLRCESCDRKMNQMIYKIIPKCVQIHTGKEGEDEVAIYLKYDNCQKLVCLYKDDNPTLHISCITENLAFCNVCHSMICNLFLRNNVKYKIKNLVN